MYYISVYALARKIFKSGQKKLSNTRKKIPLKIPSENFKNFLEKNPLFSKKFASVYCTVLLHFLQNTYKSNLEVELRSFDL